MALVLTSYAWKNLLTDGTQAASGVAGVFNNCKEWLYTNNNLTPSINNVLGDVTEASFTGYSRSAAQSWSSPLVRQSGGYQVFGTCTLYQATSGNVQQSVFGRALVDGAGANLLALESFGSPVAFNVTGDSLSSQPVLSFGGIDNGDGSQTS